VALGLFLAGVWIFVGRLGYVEFGVARRVLLGGSVRRLVGARIHLRNLESAIEAAATPSDCWVAIREASRQLGFQHVRVSLRGEAYEQQFRSNGEACWTLRIPLSERDYVNCAREVNGHEAAGAAFFAHLLGSKLIPKLAALRPSAILDPEIAALARSLEIASTPAFTASASLN
jgi:hypothetical protein